MKIQFFCSINIDKHEVKRTTTDYVGFKRVGFKEFEIEIETHFLTVNNPSFNSGLVHSQLKI